MKGKGSDLKQKKSAGEKEVREMAGGWGVGRERVSESVGVTLDGVCDMQIPALVRQGEKILFVFVFTQKSDPPQPHSSAEAGAVVSAVAGVSEIVSESVSANTGVGVNEDVGVSPSPPPPSLSPPPTSSPSSSPTRPVLSPSPPPPLPPSPPKTCTVLRTTKEIRIFSQNMGIRGFEQLYSKTLIRQSHAQVEEKRKEIASRFERRKEERREGGGYK